MTDKAQAVNLVMDILFEYENELSDGYFYYLPIDKQADDDGMEPEDAQKMTLWRICEKIVDCVCEVEGVKVG